ncbi:MAG: hypothetical protein R3B83_03805 [Nitrospirales bacterium]|nr:hypothetical protein [Nitrospirales bacterium]
MLTERTLLDIPEEPIQTMHAGLRVLHTKTSICDSFGTPSFLLGISEDITSRKAMEDQIDAMRMNSKRKWTGGPLDPGVRATSHASGKIGRPLPNRRGVAHEINNPLASIAQALTLVKRAIP